MKLIITARRRHTLRGAALALKRGAKWPSETAAQLREPLPKAGVALTAIAAARRKRSNLHLKQHAWP